MVVFFLVISQILQSQKYNICECHTHISQKIWQQIATNRGKSTFTENSSKHQQDIHSSQVTMETSTKTDHILGHKTKSSKFKGIEIVQSIFYGNEPDISNRITGKSANTWKVNNILLYNSQVKHEVPKLIKN